MISLFSVLAGLFIVSPVHAQQLEQPPEPVAVVYRLDAFEGRKAYVEDLISIYSEKYHVSGKDMMRVMLCENDTLDFDRQSEWIHEDGTREDPWGVSQIHLPSNKDISYEQAISPEFSVSFMAQKFAQGQSKLWTCARKLGV